MNNVTKILGAIANIMCLFVFVPQIVLNFRNRRCTGVNFFLILFWVCADLLSLLCAQAKGMDIIVIITSMLRVVLDVCLLSQCFYFLTEEDTIIEVVNTLRKRVAYTIIGYVSVFIIKFLLHAYPDLTDAITWIATVLFISSRVHQLTHNFRRKSVSGLSLTMFIFMIISNLMILAALLNEVISDADNLDIYLQFIVGLICTTSLDVGILFQFWLYQSHDIYDTIQTF